MQFNTSEIRLITNYVTANEEDFNLEASWAGADLMLG